MIGGSLGCIAISLDHETIEVGVWDTTMSYEFTWQLFVYYTTPLLKSRLEYRQRGATLLRSNK